MGWDGMVWVTGANNKDYISFAIQTDEEIMMDKSVTMNGFVDKYNKMETMRDLLKNVYNPK